MLKKGFKQEKSKGDVPSPRSPERFFLRGRTHNNYSARRVDVGDQNPSGERRMGGGGGRQRGVKTTA